MTAMAILSANATRRLPLTRDLGAQIPADLALLAALGAARRLQA